TAPYTTLFRSYFGLQQSTRRFQGVAVGGGQVGEVRGLLITHLARGDDPCEQGIGGRVVSAGLEEFTGQHGVGEVLAAVGGVYEGGDGCPGTLQEVVVAQEDLFTIQFCAVDEVASR